jgi:ABC-2 type transport system permease protein
MTAMLRAELLKLATTRTFVALTAAALLTSLLICALVSLLTEPTESSVLTHVFTADTSGLFIVVLAVVGITGEWRHRTITGSLLAAPDRLRFLAAKTLAFAAAGLLLSLLVSAAVAIVGMTLLSVRDLPTPGLGEVLGQIARNAEVAALSGALGVAIGGLLRNQAAAIVGVLLLSFLVEPTVLALAPEVGRFGPFSGLPAAVAEIPPEDVGAPEANLLSPWPAALAMIAWIGALFAVAVTLLRRRDLH